MNKKGDIGFQYIIAGILALLLIAAIIYIVSGRLGQGNNVASGAIDDTGHDKDGDGIPNLLDRCCGHTPPGDKVGLDGCSIESPDNYEKCT